MLAQLASNFKHFNNRCRRFFALIANASAATVNGLFESIDRKDTERDGLALFQG